jgi:uncharacterized lipoprotein YbaY/heat shock protein HslJ
MSDRLVTVFFAAGLLAACASPSAVSGQSGKVSGTVAYRERIAMPPDAVIEVVLEDVSRMDAPATVLGSVTIEHPGNVPVAFEIPYDPKTIDERYTYSVRARIVVGGRLRWVSDTVNPVLTRGAGESVNIMLTAAGSDQGAAARTSPLGDLPATFTGTVPCASCPGIEMHVDLFADQTFYLRRTYLEQEPGRFDDVGRWVLSPGGDVLTLHGGGESPSSFTIVSPNEIRLRSVTGEEIESELPYELTRADAFAPIEPELALRGMYRYMADAAVLRECLTGRNHQVQGEGAAVLEAAYLEARGEPGDELLVEVEGQLAMREGMEGGPRPTVLVRRLIRITPRESCGAPMSTADFTETYWKLTLLRDEAVTALANQPEPHLIFRAAEGSVAGSGGCNRISGTYKVEGSILEIGRMASTMMACLEGMDTESAFLAAIEEVRSWRILGQHLELFDAAGARLTRFEATHFD